MEEVAAVTQFAYSGVQVQCVFTGTAVYARMNGGGNYFNVLVDGVLHNVIHTSEALEIRIDNLAPEMPGTLPINLGFALSIVFPVIGGIAQGIAEFQVCSKVR